MKIEAYIDTDYKGRLPNMDKSGEFDTPEQAQAYVASELTRLYGDKWERNGNDQWNFIGNYSYNVAFLCEVYTPYERAIMKRDQLKMELAQVEKEIVGLELEKLHEAVAQKGKELYGHE